MLLNNITFSPGPYPYSAVIGKQLKIEGFMLTRWLAEFPQAGKVILGWVREVWSILIILS